MNAYLLSLRNIPGLKVETGSGIVLMEQPGYSIFSQKCYSVPIFSQRDVQFQIDLTFIQNRRTPLRRQAFQPGRNCKANAVVSKPHRIETNAYGFGTPQACGCQFRMADVFHEHLDTQSIQTFG